MLVLSRRTGEELVIEIGDVLVTVAVIEHKYGDKVRLGITAPQSVRVNRREVWESIQADLRRQKGN